MELYQSAHLIIQGESQFKGNLWLGNYQAAKNQVYLKCRRINHVITAGQGMQIFYQSNICHVMFPMWDCQNENIYQFFQKSYQFISFALQNGNLLVHCYAGISRSATLVIAYLMRKNSWSYHESSIYVKKKRSYINPNSGFKKQLQKFQQHLNHPTENIKPILGNEKQLLKNFRHIDKIDCKLGFFSKNIKNGKRSLTLSKK